MRALDHPLERTPVRTLTRIAAAIATIGAVLASTLIASSPASAEAWVGSPTWSNLHVKTEDGVFERFKREFDEASVLQTQSETQHNQAWVRTDRNDVTVEYRGGVANAGKQVQFILDGDVPFTDSIDGDVNIAVTDETGYASVTMTVTGDSQAEDVLRADITNGTVTVGTMVILFQDAGYFPVIKLVGTGTGPRAVCSTTNMQLDSRIYPHQCLDSDLTEQTWGWSVFKKSWLPEYSQVYVKSYLAGSTMSLLYHVTDIWGTPIASKQIQLVVDPKCRLCKWASFKGTKSTSATGYVSFTVQNKNTTKEVFANSFTNADTKTREHGYVAFAVLPTTNELEESVDHFWPQLVSDITVKSNASTLTTFTRGELAADVSGNVIVNGAGGLQINPALEIDTLGTSAGDTNTVTLNITYLKNSLPIILYAPDIKVSANNGGRIGLVTPSRQPDYYLDASKMVTSLTFGYTYPQKFVFACTKPGTTTFTILMGKTKKTYEIDCVQPAGVARHLVPLTNNQIGIPGAPVTVKFLVADRFGNGVANIPVDIDVDGTVTRVNSDAKGVVSAPATATIAGNKIVTATAVTDGLTSQFADAANADFAIKAGNASITSTVQWGAITYAVARGKGLAKVTIVNGKGKTFTVTDGKKKYSIKPKTANFTATLKLTKGAHKLVIVGGGKTQSFAITVL